MHSKLTFGALAIAVGFAAVPVVAQTTSQQSQPQPGMMMSMPAQPGQQAQGTGGCACCQRMGMMQQQTPPAQPKP